MSNLPGFVESDARAFSPPPPLCLGRLFRFVPDLMDRIRLTPRLAAGIVIFAVAYVHQWIGTLVTLRPAEFLGF
jgi:hypothetical protein